MTESEERKPFQSDNVMEDIYGYARKMRALGEAWGALSWHENNGHGSTAALENCGEALGEIVMDYAGAIEILLDEIRKSVVDLDQNVVFPLPQCQKVYDFIGANRRKEDLCAVDYRVQELKSFIENTALPAIKLKADFEDLKKEILNKQKSAPEAVGAAAGA